MINYKKPMILANDEVSEGVYTASGDCFSVTAYRTQGSSTGFDYNVIHVEAKHSTTDHHSTTQVLTISFTGAVNYGYCNSGSAAYLSGNGTNTLKIQFSYHQNTSDSISLSDLYVVPLSGDVDVTSASLSCNYTCSQHDSLGNY